MVSDRDGAPLATTDALDLIAYLQRLGTAIGPWRKPIGARAPQRGHPNHRPAMVGAKATYKDSTGADAETSIEDGLMPRRERRARLYGAARGALPGDESPEKAKERLATAHDAEAEYTALMAAWRKANPDWDKRLTAGQELFTEHCASCHGAEGRGNGVGARFLNPRPRDFTIAQFLYRSTQAGSMPLDADLFRTLWRGLPGSSMPSWRELPENQLWLLVDFVQTFAENIDGERSKEFDDQHAALTVPSVPKVKAEDLDAIVARGKAVFAAGKCSNCHGTEGRGDGPGWITSKLSSEGRIRPRDFKPRHPLDQPALRMRGGAYPQDLYRTVFTGLGPQMPSSLADFREGWRLGAEVDRLTAAGAPAGEVEAAQKAARRALIVPLHDETLVAKHGVTRETDEAGVAVEYIDRLRPTAEGQVGDDWAMIFYVLDLMQARSLIPLAK
jgi:mono/diheme cytochrome c family protein